MKYIVLTVDICISGIWNGWTINSAHLFINAVKEIIVNK